MLKENIAKVRMGNKEIENKIFREIQLYETWFSKTINKVTPFLVWLKIKL